MQWTGQIPQVFAAQNFASPQRKCKLLGLTLLTFQHLKKSLIQDWIKRLQPAPGILGAPGDVEQDAAPVVTPSRE